MAAGDWVVGGHTCSIEAEKKQNKASLQRASIESMDRERRLIRSLREEIEIFWANCETRIRPIIEKMQIDLNGYESPMIKSVSNMRRFPIFEAAGADIGLISDDAIRHATAKCVLERMGFLQRLSTTACCLKDP